MNVPVAKRLTSHPRCDFCIVKTCCTNEAQLAQCHSALKTCVLKIKFSDKLRCCLETVLNISFLKNVVLQHLVSKWPYLMFIMTIFEMLCKVRLEYVMVFVLFCHLIVFGQQRRVVFFFLNLYSLPAHTLN